MNHVQIARINVLEQCRMAPGTAAKRFVADMVAQRNHDPKKELSKRQDEYLAGLCWMFRKQLMANGCQQGGIIPVDKPEGWI